MKSRSAITLVSVFLASATVQATPVQWATSLGGNDHWYDIVTVSTADLGSINSAGINYIAASNQALAMNGHLATPDVAGEAAFIFQTFVSPTANGILQAYWLGAKAEYLGQWQWATGGSVPQDWLGAATFIDGAEGPGSYGIAQFANNTWTSGVALQDFSQTRLTNGFVVEFNSANNVPEPATLALMGVGLAGFAVARRKKDRILIGQ